MIELGNGETIMYSELMKNIDKNAEGQSFPEGREAVWSDDWTGKVEIGETGRFLNIPVKLGLSESVVNAFTNPILGIEINEDMAGALADEFLRNMYMNYKNLMNHKDVSYEDYLQLLEKPRGGEVLVTVWDMPTEDGGDWVVRQKLIDPREGWSTLVGRNDWEYPLSLDADQQGAPDYLFSVDPRGKVLIVSNSYTIHYQSVVSSPQVLENYEEIVNNDKNLFPNGGVTAVQLRDFVIASGFFNSGLPQLGGVPHDCLADGDIVGSCGINYGSSTSTI